MHDTLARRSIHFLSKAGIIAFAHKTALVLLNRINRWNHRKRSENDQRIYDEKMEKLPSDANHVQAPVLDFRMKLRLDDKGLSRDLIIHGIREKDATGYLRPLLRDRRTIIEIGANQGYYAIMEAVDSPPGARIHAFEPHPENVDTLKMNIQLNSCADKFATVEQVAISCVDGIANLYIHDLSNWHSLADVGLQGGWRGVMQVPTLSLDTYCKNNTISHIDFVRMDVEGHEIEVVKGGCDILQRSEDCLIFMELHTRQLRQMGHSGEELLRILASLGFNYITVCGKGKFLKSQSPDYVIKMLELVTEKYGHHFFISKRKLN